MKKALLAGLAALALAVTGACAGDDADVDADLSADTNGDDASVEEYCEFAAELDSREEVPSDADLDRIVELAPEEIKDDVETLADAIKEGDMESEEASAAGERLEAWEDDHCPEDAGDNGGGDADSGGDAPSGETEGDNSGSGSDNSGSGNDGNSEDDGDTGAEVEAEVGGEDGDTTTTG